MTYHADNIRSEDSEYNVISYKYPKYTTGNKAHQDANT